jgi:hypothetical protein
MNTKKVKIIEYSRANPVTAFQRICVGLLINPSGRYNTAAIANMAVMIRNELYRCE